MSYPAYRPVVKQAWDPRSKCRGTRRKDDLILLGGNDRHRNLIVFQRAGGIHFMLVGLKTPLERGTTAPLVLEFRNAGRVTVQLGIEAPDAP